jgi:hypothetical protein
VETLNAEVFADPGIEADRVTQLVDTLRVLRQRTDGF